MTDDRRYDSEAPTLIEPVSDVREVKPVAATRPPPAVVADDDPLASLRRQAEARIGRIMGGRYHLRSLLGTGSAGAVYFAVDVRAGTEVALKVLHDRLRHREEHVHRFGREAKAASSIGHSSIVNVIDVGRDPDGSVYMALELLEGESLYEAIDRRGLSVSDIVEIGRQLLSGLAAAHARGIIHRDIKPENVFLAREPSGATRVKILDFGIAKYLQRDGGASFSTMDGLLIGTPHYMSPEVCTGGEIDEHADLWAVAVVLFHALADEPPFDDSNLGRLLMKVASGQAPSLAERRPDLPAALTAAVDRGLARDRASRWPSADAFAQALTVGGAPIAGLDWDDLDG